MGGSSRASLVTEPVVVRLIVVGVRFYLHWLVKGIRDGHYFINVFEASLSKKWNTGCWCGSSLKARIYVFLHTSGRAHTFHLAGGSARDLFIFLPVISQIQCSVECGRRAVVLVPVSQLAANCRKSSTLSAWIDIIWSRKNHALCPTG